jgi:hypothetical protein
VADLVRDLHHGGAKSTLPARAVEAHVDAALGDHPRELGQEVDVEVRAAELAVGDAVKPQVFLVSHDVADRFVLDRAQRAGVDRSLRELVARVEQLLAAQEAADVVGAKRRPGASAG